MIHAHSQVLTLGSPEATASLAAAIGPQLRPGDVLLLTGGIGAGKTHFARALIQSILAEPEDVPSPTFTLVQEYDTVSGPLWHCDLYRVNDPDEVIELGLADAFSDAICLVEWPDRLGDQTPENALHLDFETLDILNTRKATLSWSSESWDSRIRSAFTVLPTAPHEDEVQRFLEAAGWDMATRTPITGDASARSYTRLTRKTQTAVLMQDPDGNARLFARLSRHLSGLNLSAPLVMAEEAGLLLLEDMGDALFARLAVTQEIEQRLYLSAVDALVALHGHKAPATLPVATPETLAQAVDLAYTHYVTRPELAEEATTAFLPILEAHARPQDILVLRDFHAENLMYLEGRTGPRRVGLLDFQDALNGHCAYDLVSLCRDVRRDVSPETERACIDAYLAATGEDRQDFEASYAVLGVQRNLRILGVFARLALTQGKTRYLDFLPRTWAHIQDQLTHPALEPMRACVDALPEPTSAFVEDLARRCQTP